MDRDRGYALVAAITAVAAFAYIAFQVLAADRGHIVGVGARLEQAKLEAAADAGMMIAVHALGDTDPDRRWSIDGSLRRVDFNGTTLDVTVEDERGKVPLDGLNPDQSRAFFQGGGAKGERLDALVDELRSFQSGDDERVAAAADALGDTSFMAQIRQGGFRSVSDLMALKDMDGTLFARVAPVSTVFFEESGPFEPKNASSLARATMTSEDDPSNQSDQQNAADSQQPNEDADDEPPPLDVNLIGRTLTVRVVAYDRRGARTHRTAIIELTGAAEEPYWIRYAE
jgi:general secretion pathway protein K